MSFTQGLSGLNAASKNLEVVGNNVANANTVGFKGSQAQFGDVFAAALTGSGAATIGIGAKLETVAQQFTQGNISITNNSLDMAINGAGFFNLRGAAGGDVYTRNGQFQLDKGGYIVSSAGHRLQGYPPGASAIAGNGTQDLQIPTASMPATASTSVIVGLNLDSTAPVIPVATLFDPNISTTYTNATSTTGFDSQGNPLSVTMYFKKEAPNQWAVYGTVKDQTGAMISPLPATVPPTPATTWLASAGYLGQLNFNSTGTGGSATPLPVGGISFTPTSFVNAVPVPVPATQSLIFDFTTATQFAAPFGVTALTTDGNKQGTLAGFSVSPDGSIVGRYSNGKTQTLGTVAVTTFANMNGLQPLGDNEWVETGASGQALKGTPGTGLRGILQTSSVEDSNVDLTAELVNMITAQRVYQANAQTIKTQDAVMQTLINLR